MKKWKEKTVFKTKNGKIIKYENVSSIFNDVDYYTLFDSNGMFVERDLDFNKLKSKLMLI